MKFYSTKNRRKLFTLEEAVLKGLPDDNGLFMPEKVPLLSTDFWKEVRRSSFEEIAYEISKLYLTGDVPEHITRHIADEAINFPAPLIPFGKDKSSKDKMPIYVLELFHGPTLAFKDVGARFMARLMGWLNRNNKKKLTILVATSGDTGSAVANGFFNVDGIEVIILYPSGKVSPLQEKQLTTLGGNITALEIQGTFDDCQRLVKTAFLDQTLKEKYRLSSANSINIARLIPQSFYYIDTYRQIEDPTIPMVFSVPSGNFGNLTAGLLAKRMGLPVQLFIASSNVNDSVPRYLHTSHFEPHETIPTISNAMDVGNPSNFARMLDLYDERAGMMRRGISGYSFTDEQTKSIMRRVYKENGYILDPHGAVALLGIERYLSLEFGICQGIFLETAHPAKFKEVVEETLGIELKIPKELAILEKRTKNSVVLKPDYKLFHEYLNSRS